MRAQGLGARLDRLLPTPWLKLCVVLHAAAMAAVVANWRLWPWSLLVLVAAHVLLVLGSLLPRSRLLGPNWTRLPGGQHTVALTIDDGPDPDVTPAVLDLLARHQVRATFFCIGERVTQHPELARRIAREGHEIGNHSEHHRHVFSLFGPAAMRREIVLAQASIQAVCQAVPRFFRAPAGLRNPFLQPCLAELGLQLASWTRRGYDTVNADAEAVLARLTRNLKAGDILLLHDGCAARAADGTPVILAVLPGLLAVLASQRLSCITLAEGLPGP
ncbi:MAG TPA: polysaccharide deacetylase family protein [Steroidobacteraceae bacterium]|nr:polysaccharide deacetylase family protein [Steroidobacteraceae bacterium]